LFVVPSAQEAGKTVADGVYSEAQAARGASAYETSCAGCHRADLGGGTGPALKEQRFARQFADKDLRTLFSRIATTMPRNAPGSVSANASSSRTVGEALGGETYHLVDALAYAPQTHLGHKLYVRGLLIRLPGEQRITISTLEPLSPGCAE